MTDDLLQAVRDLPKVARYLHVPAQSGCDEVLKRMKRMYTVALYDDMLARIRETVPGVAVSSDFIVGFCGETEESFEKTVRLVERARFKNSFIFKYSPRPGTKADTLFIDDVPEEVKKRRNNDLLAVQNAISLEDNRRVRRPDGRGPGRGAEQVGRRRERGGGGGFGQLTGRTACDRIVVFEGHERLVGRFVPVEVEDASAVTLFGRVVTTESSRGHASGVRETRRMGEPAQRPGGSLGRGDRGSIPGRRRRRPRSPRRSARGPEPCRPGADPRAVDCVGAAARLRAAARRSATGCCSPTGSTPRAAR